MSVPELFHHQDRFIGCLTIRRVRRLPGNDALLHRTSGSQDDAYDVLLASQAFDAERVDRCPALAPDGRCTIYGDRKPATCDVVPFDALVPAELHHHVLAQRAKEAVYLGADCVSAGSRSDAPVVVRRLAIVAEGFRDALAVRRRDLADDKRVWGDAVFGMLRPDLFDDPAAVARLPVDGYFVMALAPVLMVLGDVSARLRARCITYLDAQIVLIDRALRSLAARARDAPSTAMRLGAARIAPDDGAATTHQLRAFDAAAVSLRRALAVRGPSARVTTNDTMGIEAWAGLPPGSRSERE